MTAALPDATTNGDGDEDPTTTDDYTNAHPLAHDLAQVRDEEEPQRAGDVTAEGTATPTDAASRHRRMTPSTTL